MRTSDGLTAVDQSIMEGWNAVNRAYLNSLQFYGMLAQAFVDASLICSKTFLEINTVRNLAESEKIVMSKIRDIFDSKLREKGFVSIGSETVESYSELAKITGFGKVYQNISTLASVWNWYTKVQLTSRATSSFMHLSRRY